MRSKVEGRSSVISRGDPTESNNLTPTVEHSDLVPGGCSEADSLSQASRLVPSSQEEGGSSANTASPTFPEGPGDGSHCLHFFGDSGSS